VASRPIAATGTLRFGDDFELDVRAYELRSAGIPLKLKPIAMELLLFLVERSGELITRQQIVECIWGKGVFLDTDNSINGAISKIRQVLRDDPEQPRCVQTVTGSGYRFIAPVVGNRVYYLAAPSSTPRVATCRSVLQPESALRKYVFSDLLVRQERVDERLWDSRNLFSQP
jgi:DNA-binding winged helix-turn-helix (wHTH) protein